MVRPFRKTSHSTTSATDLLVAQVDTEIEQYVRTCPPCQRNKNLTDKTYGLLVPVQIPERRWSSISVDFITHLPRTEEGHDAITVFVDRLSKRVHLIPSRTSDKASKFASDFVKHIFSQHGLPREIISDRDSKFVSSFWEEVTKMLGVQRCMSTSFHPRSDGQTERMNRTLEEVLRAYVAPDQSDWDHRLPLAEFAMNNTVNSSIGTTPFLMEYGQHPLTPASLPVASQNTQAFKFVANWEHRVKQVKIMMKAAQHRQKTLFDRNVQDKRFKVGQQVLVSTRHMAMKGSKVERRKKLTPKYIGPYPILEEINPVAYKLKLPEHMKLHPVFHVSLLREFKSDDRRATEAPEVDLIDGEVHLAMDRIVDERQTGRKKYTQFLVRWKGDSDETWEFEEDLLEDAPQFAKTLIKQFRASRDKRLKTKGSSK